MYFYNRDNIRFGYRAHRGNLDLISCAKTAFCIHCETLNIWTHGIPAIYFLFQAFQIIYAINFPDKNDVLFNQLQTLESKVVLLIGCSSMIFCMTSSTCYHLFTAINQKLADHLLRIDLVGISVMIFVCTLTSVRTGFYSDPTARDGIMIMMMSLFIGNALISATPCYN